MLKLPNLRLYVLPFVIAAISLTFVTITFYKIKVPALQDGYTYIALAKSLLETGKYSLYNQPYVWREPLFPTLVALLSIPFKNAFLAAKIISASFGIITIPLIYWFWKKVENVNVALIGSFLFAIAPVASVFRVLPMTESLFAFFVALTCLLFYLSEKKSVFYAPMSISAGLSALTRPEGYLLVLSIILGTAVRFKLFNLQNIRKFLKNWHITVSLIFSFLLPSFWWVRNVLVSGRPWPVSEYLTFTNLRLDWFVALSKAMYLPFLALAVLGIAVSIKKKWKWYLQPFAFLISLAIIYLVFPFPAERYTICAQPLLLGFSGVGLLTFVNIIRRFVTNKTTIKITFTALIFVIVVLSVIHLNYKSEEMILNAKSFEMYESFGKWFDKNSPSDAKLLAWDAAIYDYFMDAPTHDVSEFSVLGSKLVNKSDVSIYIICAAFERGIRYVEVFDSLRGRTGMVNQNIQGAIPSEFLFKETFFANNQKTDINIVMREGSIVCINGKTINFAPIIFKSERGDVTILYYLTNKPRDTAINHVFQWPEQQKYATKEISAARYLETIKNLSMH